MVARVLGQEVTTLILVNAGSLRTAFGTQVASLSDGAAAATQGAASVRWRRNGLVVPRVSAEGRVRAAEAEAGLRVLERFFNPSGPSVRAISVSV